MSPPPPQQSKNRPDGAYKPSLRAGIELTDDRRDNESSSVSSSSPKIDGIRRVPVVGTGAEAASPAELRRASEAPAWAGSRRSGEIRSSYRAATHV
jgi:hypothetical protein